MLFMTGVAKPLERAILVKRVSLDAPCGASRIGGVRNDGVKGYRRIASARARETGTARLDGWRTPTETVRIGWSWGCVLPARKKVESWMT